jgi:hypothetical protein
MSHNEFAMRAITAAMIAACVCVAVCYAGYATCQELDQRELQAALKSPNVQVDPDCVNLVDRLSSQGVDDSKSYRFSPDGMGYKRSNGQPLLRGLKSGNTEVSQ